MHYYEIRIGGHLGELMLAAFPSLSAEISGPDTILRGPIRDGAELHGMLDQVERLRLELLELRRLPARAGGSPRRGDAPSPRRDGGLSHE